MIGDLSFIAAFAKSADAKTLESVFDPIWKCISEIALGEHPRSITIMASAVVRKLIVKIHRVLAVAAIELQIDGFEAVVTDIIEHLCAALDDHDSVVRLAASKALGGIASHLEEDMKASLIELILENLEDDTGREAMTASITAAVTGSGLDATAVQPINVSSVNALRWHGHIMSLSHMIYQRSVPTGLLFRIKLALITALNLNQQTALGAAVGTNVRDAACFGIWALARKYTTQELQNMDDSFGDLGSLNLQRLATELIKAACFDPAGNIRRGASAAMQEMVGRHPNQIECGIDLVQIVDYHAVALKANAMIRVCLKASQMRHGYWLALCTGLLGWRAAQSTDAATRRLAAQSIAAMAVSGGPGLPTLQLLCEWSHLSPPSDYELKHGLLLAMAETIEMVHGRLHNHCRKEGLIEIDGVIKVGEYHHPILPTQVIPQDVWQRIALSEQIESVRILNSSRSSGEHTSILIPLTRFPRLYTISDHFFALTSGPAPHSCRKDSRSPWVCTSQLC